MQNPGFVLVFLNQVVTGFFSLDSHICLFKLDIVAAEIYEMLPMRRVLWQNKTQNTIKYFFLKGQITSKIKVIKWKYFKCVG